jgi:hypothetical protein
MHLSGRSLKMTRLGWHSLFLAMVAVPGGILATLFIDIIAAKEKSSMIPLVKGRRAC